MLDLTPLINAISRLREGLDVYWSNPAQTVVRDGLVQRFEFTYELSHRMLKRHLAEASPLPEQYDTMPFPDLIRSGNQQGLLLGDWPRWREYREMRAKTSHTYDEAIALEVVAEIPAFLEEVQHLCDQISRRQGR